MADKRNKPSLAREGEPSQETEKGLEIPVPKRGEFFDALAKASIEELGSREAFSIRSKIAINNPRSSPL
jgi:hypothetical protein